MARTVLQPATLAPARLPEVAEKALRVTNDDPNGVPLEWDEARQALIATGDGAIWLTETEFHAGAGSIADRARVGDRLS